VITSPLGPASTTTEPPAVSLDTRLPTTGSSARSILMVGAGFLAVGLVMRRVRRSPQPE